MPAKKPVKKPAAKPTKKLDGLPKVTVLLKATIATLQQNPRLFWLVALIMVPTTYLTAGSTDSSAFGSVAAILMNVALVWSVIEVCNGRSFKLKQAYYTGTAPFVRFTLVALALVFMLLPMVIGLSLAGLGVLPSQALPSERLLVGALAIVLSAPTIYWLTRYGFALFGVFEDLAPMQAIRRSGRLVKGRWFAVAKRLAAIVVILAILASMPLVALAVTKGALSDFWLSALQVATAIAGLPLLNTYNYLLYRALDGQKPSR